VKVRSKFLGDLKPASMLAVIPALVRPNFLVEIEFIAAKAAPSRGSPTTRARAAGPPG
jgi:hypothetical protein